MAFKKGVLTESDIRVIEAYSKKNLSDSIQEADSLEKTRHQSNQKDTAEKS